MAIRVDLAQAFIDAASPADKRPENSPAGTAFSTALRNASQQDSKAQVAPKTLPLAPSHPMSVTSSPLVMPQQSINERALGLRAYRQELIASNIANADTPGYKAVDFDINEALQTGKTKENLRVQYRIPAQGSVDGNTVDMDAERVQFAENGLMYEYSVDRVRGYYKMMDELLKGVPY